MRVSRFARATARGLGLDARAVEQAAVAGRLHDLGKIGVPDDILWKPDVLTADERAIMRRHAELGWSILRDAPLPDTVKQAVRSVHERWDGGAYPDGLTGAAIPVLARILAVSDAFEAMTTDRPYRKAMSRGAAFERLRRAAGSQLDPEIVDVFIRTTQQMPLGPDRRPSSG